MKQQKNSPLRLSLSPETPQQRLLTGMLLAAARCCWLLLLAAAVYLGCFAGSLLNFSVFIFRLLLSPFVCLFVSFCLSFQFECLCCLSLFVSLFFYFVSFCLSLSLFVSLCLLLSSSISFLVFVCLFLSPLSLFLFTSPRVVTFNICILSLSLCLRFSVSLPLFFISYLSLGVGFRV